MGAATVGPVQLLVIGFELPGFEDAVIVALNGLRETGQIRLLDTIFVYKDCHGQVEFGARSDLRVENPVGAGAYVGSLLGPGPRPAVGQDAGSGAEAIRAGHESVAADVGFGGPIESLREDSAAAAVLLEHVWAIPLLQAVRDAHGVKMRDQWVRPRDLVAVGLAGAEDVVELLDP